jgi:hypothetical protein
MKFISVIGPLFVATVVAISGIAIAADTKPDQKAAQSTQGTNRTDMNRMMQGGMGGMMRGDSHSADGMMHGGMMNMMDECSQMMGGASRMSSMPKLPSGNEKLQLQMEAEMMQKIGEILSSYASRLPDAQRSGR